LRRLALTPRATFLTLILLTRARRHGHRCPDRVPALMKLLGDANWWMPRWTGIVLRIPRRKPEPEIAVEPTV
jgi:hypothetical protein